MSTEFDYTGLNTEIAKQYGNIDNAIEMSRKSAMASTFANVAPILSNLYLLFKKRSQYTPIEKISAKTIGYKPTDVSSLQLGMLDKQVNTAMDASKKYGAFENIPLLISKYADEATKIQAMQSESAARERQQVIEANNREQARADQTNIEIDQRNWANKMQLQQYNEMLESSALQGISDTIASTTQAWNQSRADIAALNDKKSEMGLWLEQMKFMYPEKQKSVELTPERRSSSYDIERSAREKNKPGTIIYDRDKFLNRLSSNKIQSAFPNVTRDNEVNTYLNEKAIERQEELEREKYAEEEGLFDPNWGYVGRPGDGNNFVSPLPDEPIIPFNQQSTSQEFNPFGKSSNESKDRNKANIPYFPIAVGTATAYSLLRNVPQFKSKLNPFSKSYKTIQPDTKTSAKISTPTETSAPTAEAAKPTPESPKANVTEVVPETTPVETSTKVSEPTMPKESKQIVKIKTPGIDASIANSKKLPMRMSTNESDATKIFDDISKKVKGVGNSEKQAHKILSQPEYRNVPAETRKIVLRKISEASSKMSKGGFGKGFSKINNIATIIVSLLDILKESKDPGYIDREYYFDPIQQLYVKREEL